MKRKLFHRPSPAMIVASVALIVALGGTSYAAINLPASSVGTKQLKKNAVTGAKVKNGSLAAGDFKAASLPRGPQGLQGPQGIQGPPGAPGQSKATTVTVRSSAEGTGSVTADCQSGETALGGGAFSENGFIWDTTPSPDTGTPTGWFAQAALSGGGAATVQAFVVCGAP